MSNDGSRTSDSAQVMSDTRSMKSLMRSGSIKSLTPATYENSNVAVYEVGNIPQYNYLNKAWIIWFPKWINLFFITKACRAINLLLETLD